MRRKFTTLTAALAVFVLTCAVLALIAKPYANFVVYYILSPLRGDINALTRNALEILLAALPAVIILGPQVLWVRYLRRRQDRMGPAKEQLEALSSARKALADSSEFLAVLAADIEVNQKRQAQLEAQIETLKSLSSESADAIRQKLAAISFATRRQEYLRIAVAFFLGVVSSLVASAIWELFQRAG